MASAAVAAVLPAQTPAARHRDLAHEIAALASLDLADLRIRWRRHLRTAPPPQLSRALLMRLLAYRIQAKVLGDLDRDTARLLERIARERLRRRDSAERAPKPKAPPIVPPIPHPGLRPGTLLVREFAGVVHTITVEAKGFAWGGTTYASLSEVARAITGTRWNGPRFFGLRDKAVTAAASAASAASDGGEAS